jgi:HEAT repeat protein
MKVAVRLFMAVAVLIAIASPASSSGKDDVCGSQTIASLMMAIQSDNQGLRESAAFVLGEIKCAKAIIPLMEMLHNGEKESTRIVAALALTLIGEARGVYAVKQAVRFDTSSRVQVLCAYFYNTYYQPGTFAFVQTVNPSNFQVVLK